METERDKIRIIVPDEQLVTAEMKIEGKPYVGVFNKALYGFSGKEAFGWYLSIIIWYDKTVGDEMPDDEDTVRMQDFSETLSDNLSADRIHPNALFLGRVTGDGCTQIMWYVNKPGMAVGYLEELISSESYPLEFEYEIENDVNWEEADYWLRPLFSTP